MIFKKNYNGNCWWCGNIANSKEHKIKRTDFVHVFGKGPYQNKDERPVLVKGGKEIPIQSPKSDFIKFNDCFCKVCNNDRSSEMDRDYTQFMEYTRNSELKIFADKIIDTRDVFGNEWKKGKRNVYKYWVKHIACQAATGGYEVSNNLIGFLEDKEDLIDINFLFQFREYNYVFANMMKKSGSNFEQMFIGKTRFYSKKEFPENAIETLTGWYTLNWFSMNYAYEKGIVREAYGNANPLDEPKIEIRIVRLEEVPSLVNSKSNKEIFERMEDFDRGEKLEDSFQFLEMLKKEKNTICKS